MSRYIITHVSYRIAQKAFNPSKKKKNTRNTYDRYINYTFHNSYTI